MYQINLSIFAAFLFVSVFFTEHVSACTRVVYQAPADTIITGRNMDWKDEIPANMWVFPKGIKRNGSVGKNSVTWTSKYGSVAVSSFDIATSDGMNEKGLVGNLLWLAESEYPKFDKTSGQKGLSISLWLQYVLDNFATVEEAVKALSKEDFVVYSFNLPGTERFTTLHMSISDKTGDSAIFEYIHGKLVIHHSRDYVAMTNSPTFDKQLAIETYWKDIPGTVMLPGTNRAADRFVRASFYMDAVPKTDNTKIAVPTVFSVIRNVSVPYGISTPGEPNISSTRWRTVSDQKNLVYYYEDVLNPNVVWVDFKNLNFNKGSGIKKLSLDHNHGYMGESSHELKTSKPFTFAGEE